MARHYDPDMLDVGTRVVMVSGPARGIGRAVAERLHTDGFRLSLGARNPDSLTEMIEGWDPDSVSVHTFDGTDSATARSWVEETAAAHGAIDALVNNAGVLHGFTLDTYDEAQFDEMWEVNVKAPTLLTHLVLDHLRRSGDGRVVNLASLSGKRVKGGFSPGYAMTKHAVMALTHATRQTGWDDGIRATAICPSFVETDMIAHVDTGAEPVIGVHDLAELVSTALRLPGNASVPEILVNCRLEDMV